jgi:hypothetical protein
VSVAMVVDEVVPPLVLLNLGVEVRVVGVDDGGEGVLPALGGLVGRSDVPALGLLVILRGFLSVRRLLRHDGAVGAGDRRHIVRRERLVQRDALRRRLVTCRRVGLGGFSGKFFHMYSSLRMVDEVTRRRLLYGGWVAGAVGVAGCSDVLETGTSPDDETGDSTPSGESSGEDTSSGLDLIETSLETTELTEGEAVVVTVDVVNARDATTEFDIRLRVGDREAGIETISLEGGEEASIEFKEAIETTGTQAVNVNEEAVGTVVVRAKRPDIVRDVAANY